MDISRMVDIILTAPRLQLTDTVARMSHMIQETMLGQERRPVAYRPHDPPSLYRLPDNRSHLGSGRGLPPEATYKHKRGILVRHTLERITLKPPIAFTGSNDGATIRFLYFGFTLSSCSSLLTASIR